MGTGEDQRVTYLVRRQCAHLIISRVDLTSLWQNAQSVGDSDMSNSLCLVSITFWRLRYRWMARLQGPLSLLSHTAQIWMFDPKGECDFFSEKVQRSQEDTYVGVHARYCNPC